MEEIVGVYGEYLVFLCVDIFKLVSLDDVGQQHRIVIFHFLDVLTGNVTEVVETVDDLLKSESEIVIDDVG